MKDGQTLVIGGIYVVDKSNAQTRVPYLHKIPIFGALFRNNRVFDNRDELFQTSDLASRWQLQIGFRYTF